MLRQDGCHPHAFKVMSRCGRQVLVVLRETSSIVSHVRWESAASPLGPLMRRVVSDRAFEVPVVTPSSTCVWIQKLMINQCKIKNTYAICSHSQLTCWLVSKNMKNNFVMHHEMHLLNSRYMIATLFKTISVCVERKTQEG